MANRYGLGRAQFDIVINNEQALRTFVQTEMKAREGSARIAAALNAAEGPTTKLSGAFVNLVKVAGPFALAAVGISQGMQGFTNALNSATEAMLRQKQAQFELNQAYKEGAKEYTQFAEQLARQSNRLTTEIQASVTAFAVLQQNYALTSEQIKTLTVLTANYAAKSGRDMVQSAADIQAAIRGEGEAVEKLGLTLGRDFVRGVQEMTEAQRKNFYTISDMERAQILLAQAQQQGLQYQTAITDRAKDDLGTYDAWNTAIGRLNEAIGVELNKALQITLPPLTNFVNIIAGAEEPTLAQVEAVKSLAFAFAFLRGDVAGAVKAMQEINAERRRATAMVFPAIPNIPGADAGLPGAGPTEKQIEATRKAMEDFANSRRLQEKQAETELKNALQNRLTAIQAENTARQRALDQEIVWENERYENIKNKTALEKKEREDTAKAVRDAAISAIEDEEEVFNRAQDEKLAQLRAEREERQTAAQSTRDRTVRAAEVERDAIVAASEEQITQLEIQKEEKLRQLEQGKDAALDAIETEKTVVMDSIDSMIAHRQRQKEISSRELEDAKDAALEAIEEEEQESERAFERRIERQEEAKDNAIENIEKEKEARLKALEEEERNTDRIRQLQDRDIDNQEEALNRRRQLEDRDRERQQELEKRALEQRQEEQERALEDRNKNLLYQLQIQEKAELDALDNRNEAVEDSYNKQRQLIQDTAEDAIEALDKERDALEENHRRTLSEIDAEKRARIDEIESRIRATNELQRAFSSQNKVADLNQDLEIAERKGDLTGAARIREELRREQIRQTLETASATLKAQKDAIDSELDARKAAADEEYRIRRDAIDAEKKLIKEAADYQLEALKNRREQVKSTYEEEKKLIQERYDEANRLVKERYTEEKRQLEDQQKLEDQILKDRFEVIENFINDQRYAEDQLHDRRLELIQDARDKEDEAYRLRRESIEASYKREREEIEDTHDRTVSRLREQAQEAKDRFADRKKAAQETYDAEKRNLQDLYDDPVNGVFAKLREQKETAEREFAARKKAADETYQSEKQQIHDTYSSEATGLIPAIKRAVDRARIDYAEKKRIADEAYNSEQRQIYDTYDHPVNGLFRQHERMVQDARTKFNERKEAVETAYNREKDLIYEIYDKPVTGLIALQKKQHDDIIGNLNTQKQRWQDWETDTSRNIRNVLNGPLKDFINKIKELEEAGFIEPGSARPPEEQPGIPGAPGSNAGGPGNVNVPSPYTTLFPFGAPYNGPFGGAQWPGGPTHHRGIDLTLPGPNGGRGGPVGAFRNGTVIAVTNDSAGGNGYIIQNPDDGLYEYYGHFDSQTKKQGDKVKRGDIIGTLGASGLDPGMTPHLHYEVRKNPGGDPLNNLIDPRPYMNGFENTARGGLPSGEEVIELRPFGPHGAVVKIRAKALGLGGDWFARSVNIAKQAQFSDPQLFGRQMRHESSNFDPKVISGERNSEAGAQGIAQFMPSTARMLGVNPLDPIASLKAAAGYMRQLELKYGGVRNALWAYNAGEGHFQAGIMPAETRQYLQILQGYKDGKMIMEPTLMIGLRSGEAGIAGETGQPERLLGTTATAAYDRSGAPSIVHHQTVIGGEVISELWVQGIKQTVREGRHIGLPGITIR